MRTLLINQRSYDVPMISSMFTRLSAALALVAGLSLSAHAQPAQVLSSAQIVEAFVGKTISQVDDQYWAYFEPGGRLAGLYVNDVDEGIWGFYQNQICQRWNNWAGGADQCFYVLRGVGGAFRLDDGSGGGFNVTVQTGNTQGL